MVQLWDAQESCVVLAEGWPSWTFALDALGCREIMTLASFSSALEREEFKATRVGPTRVVLKDLRLRWSELGLKPHVLVQGSAAFSDSMRKLIDELGAASVTELVGLEEEKSRTMQETRFRQISHKQVGGVTTGKWRIFTTEDTQNWQTPKISKCLKHILKSTEGGRKLESTNLSIAAAAEALLPSARATFGARDVKVHCPCVFGKTMVERRLGIEELMDVYDIELESQRELKTFWKTSGVTPSRSFVSQVPVKVLLTVGRNLFRTRVSKSRISGTDKSRETEVNEDPRGSGGYEEERIEEVADEFRKPDVIAVKSDDADVDVDCWNRYTVNSFDPSTTTQRPLFCVPGTYSLAHRTAFDKLRGLMLRRCRRNAFRGLVAYLNSEHEALGWSEEVVPLVGPFKGEMVKVKVPGWAHAKFRQGPGAKGDRRSKPRGHSIYRDLSVGRDAIERLCNSSFWNWDDGSTPLFWRWPRRYQKIMRDGSKQFVRRQHLPHYFRRQRWPEDPGHCAACEKKIAKVRDRRYVCKGEVVSLTGFFAVPKGADDIRMVYDATKCGLNAALWAPNFGLPTIDTVLRNADDGTWFGDIDLGEMFLNYFLDEELRSYCGLDLREKFSDATSYERWERALMGLRLSPYLCTQNFAWSCDCIKGHRLEESNPLRWDEVKLNLPGSPEFDPKQPWVYKWDSTSQQLAAFFVSYMDDIRTGAPSEDLAWKTSRRVASMVNYFGQQDAPRKRRPPSKEPGAWAGAMCAAKEGVGLYVTCSQEKWDKGKDWIVKWKALTDEGCTTLNFKELEKGCGFLVHLSRTFPAIFPYLKGLYNTMNSWRLGRDGDGWKYSMSEWKILLEMEEERSEAVHRAKKEYVHTKAVERPVEVDIVPRLIDDLAALMTLFESKEPPQRLVRGQELSVAVYGFGDASGGGFGASWETTNGTRYRYGTWGRDEEDGSSNLRELKNLVETLEDMGEDGSLNGVEVFMFTDNSTAENAFHRGSSSSKQLFELVLRIRKLEMEKLCRVHLCHVAGTRMIAQGSDGLSRGNVSEGVMRGEEMLSFIPMHLSALERSPGLASWVLSWAGDNVEFLEPRDWFVRGQDLLEEECEVNVEGMKFLGHKYGKFVWSPPPAAGDAAVEALRAARHKGQRSTHVMLIPRLMQPIWQRTLHKAADLVLTIPAGHSVWGNDMHEPLTLAFCFPYLRHDPWEIKRVPALLELGVMLSEVWKSGEGNEGPLLRELWGFQERISSMPESMALKVLFGRRKPSISDS